MRRSPDPIPNSELFGKVSSTLTRLCKYTSDAFIENSIGIVLAHLCIPGRVICTFDCKTLRKIALFWQPPLALHARCLSLVNYLALPPWASLLPYTFLQLVTCNCLYCYSRFKTLTFFLFQLPLSRDLLLLSLDSSSTLHLFLAGLDPLSDL